MQSKPVTAPWALSFAGDLGGTGALRFGWGRYLQSQRPHELAAEFGETAFHPAESAEHFTVGFEKHWG